MSRRLAAYGLAAAWFALDRLTKVLVQGAMAPQDVFSVIPGFFEMVYTRNRGIAFGLMSEGDFEWRAFFLIGLTALVMAFVVAILWQSPPRGMMASRLTRLGLALVLGGALGNLYDRLLEGSVTDFLSFHAGSFYWPAFNVADSGITVGACLVLLDLWRNRHRPVET